MFFFSSSFSYLPWFEVYYKLLNTLADYLAKEQVILHILFLCVKDFPCNNSHYFKCYKGILHSLNLFSNIQKQVVKFIVLKFKQSECTTTPITWIPH